MTIEKVRRYRSQAQFQDEREYIEASEVDGLVEAVERYRLAVEMMNMAMRDGLNVQGAISNLSGREDNLDYAIARFAK